MPEGHSVHRIARQFDKHFVGQEVTVTSPQGRFASDARLVNGHSMVEAHAIGKQMFLGFDNDLWMRVHLGIYGAWDFAGDIATGDIAPTATLSDKTKVVGAHEDSLRSIGAPRRARLHMAETESFDAGDSGLAEFPPPPVGQVRARLLTAATLADLRGPTVCEVIDNAGVAAVAARLGPDPLIDDGEVGLSRFAAAVRRRNLPVGQLLMDQSVVAGIGNVYRAELLFRARLNPFAPGSTLAAETVAKLWADWTYLLRLGVDSGLMLTMDGLKGAEYEAALANRADRHWVYHRTGLPCRVCGSAIAMQMLAGRKLYWCPSCQSR